MNMYRVKINGVDCGVYLAGNIDMARMQAVNDWERVYGKDTSVNIVITREV